MRAIQLVIAGLDPAIHLVFETMDARVKPAHEGFKFSESFSFTA
jgi:hypothetical protein